MNHDGLLLNSALKTARGLHRGKTNTSYAFMSTPWCPDVSNNENFAQIIALALRYVWSYGRKSSSPLSQQESRGGAWHLHGGCKG